MEPARVCGAPGGIICGAPGGINRGVAPDVATCTIEGTQNTGSSRIGLGADTAPTGQSFEREDSTVKRTPVNPWEWSVQLGFNQAELVEGATQVMYLSGQSAVNSDGQPQHRGDMAGQIELSLDNLESVLAAADMSLSNIVRLNIYTTEVDALLVNYSLILDRMGSAGVKPPSSLLGVARLAFPELMVELEATAVA